jgi:hypothetical protein
MTNLRYSQLQSSPWFEDAQRLAVGRPLADGDLLLSRADGTPLPVRDYSREFAAQRDKVLVSPSKGIRRQRAIRSPPQLQDHNPCRRWASPPSDTRFDQAAPGQ